MKNNQTLIKFLRGNQSNLFAKFPTTKEAIDHCTNVIKSADNAGELNVVCAIVVNSLLEELATGLENGEIKNA